ncbi:diiron oxygenase [Myxococcota bacterium]|nr:diiron oxygenase [Myxococcota bacterium]
MVNPYTAFEWPETVDKEAHWFMPKEMISLYGTPAFDALTEAQQKKLSFYEMVNFFSLVIAGERLLIQKLVRYLYKPEYKETTEYLHHFLDEENRHMVWFGNFCRRYAGKVYNSRHYPLPTSYAPGEEEFHFWVSVLVFEEMGDIYNVAVYSDEGCAPIAQQINLFHHREESRHLAFGRSMTKEVWDRVSPGWTPEVKARVRNYVSSFLVSEFRDYFNPAVYQDAGVPDRYKAREAALASPAAAARFEKVTANCVKVLTEAGILEEPPVFQVV